jgi:DNA topoisomerase VI subunit B
MFAGILHGEIQPSLVLPIIFVGKLLGSVVMHLTRDTATGDQLEKALVSQLNHIDKKLDTLFLAGHKAAAEKLKRLARRVPDIMKEGNGTNDLKQLEDDANDLVNEMEKVYSSLPDSTIMEKIENTKIAISARSCCAAGEQRSSKLLHPFATGRERWLSSRSF